jgi:hypothetical protein
VVETKFASLGVNYDLQCDRKSGSSHSELTS